MVVVTKTHPAETIQPAIEAGARCLGENYADEALPKIQAFSAFQGIEWHMIGHVQSRKARLVAEYFAYLHSLDSLKLARKLDSYCSDLGKRLPVLLECNVSGEESKFGYPAWQEDQWETLLPEIEEIASLPHPELRGLMTMAPYLEDPEQARPYFIQLRNLRDYLQSKLTKAGLPELSMGMSADYEVAIEEGATWVRVGTAIFGPRS
jgi:pyridoxal phosphate enzyme (YggS family)